ncbi:MAG: Calx-beta domain-containing protein, partial [Candidatus Omnitrophota bacterium]
STVSYNASVSYTLSTGDGQKTLYTWYKDAAGNVSSVSQASITLDTTSPVITISSPTDSDTYSTSSSTLSLSGTASDAASGLSAITYTLNSGASLTTSAATSWSIANLSLQTGTNTITVTATDNAGNSSTDTLTVTYTPAQTGTIAFSSATYSRSEGYTSATITVTRSAGSDGAASIQYSTTDGSATSGQDYTSTSGSLNWADGVSANRTFTIPITADTIDEPNETVNLTLTNATGASLGTLASAVLTINDNDNPPTVAFTSTSQSKAENQGTATITLQLSSESAQEITLPFTLSGTAQADGTDYSIIPSPLTIPAGQTSVDISVTLTNDSTYESQDETVIITLGTPTNATRGSPSSHTLTISDDDPIPDTTAPTVSISIPTSDATYSTTSGTLSLSGTASDDTTLSSVTWSSDKGGSGTATLTDSAWSVSGISLSSGDNLITVTASDSSTNTSSDSLTVTYTPITAPTVTTLAASSITQDSVALNGSANPNSDSATVWFEYGTASGSYPNTTPTQALSGSTSQSVSASLSSLSSNTTYYYRLASQNSAGTSYGLEMSFTTSAAGDTTAPTVIITTPKLDSNKKYSLTYAPFINIHRASSDTIDISGKASDDVKITSMSWYDDQGNTGPIITSDNYLYWLAK